MSPGLEERVSGAATLAERMAPARPGLPGDSTGHAFDVFDEVAALRTEKSDMNEAGDSP